MELVNNILDNTTIKYIIIILLILYISTINPPINSLISSFYNNIFGKILLLLLILYYSNGKKELGLQISMLLTLLYIVLLNTNITQNNITSYGKLINNNLIGGVYDDKNNDENFSDDDNIGNDFITDYNVDDEGDYNVDDEGDYNQVVDEGDYNQDDDIEENIGKGVENTDSLKGGILEEGDNLLSSEEESLINDINKTVVMEEEVAEEQDIDKKINHIIQEEIVLNKSTYKRKMKNSRKLGATQYKLNNKLSKAQNKLKKQTAKYKTSEEEYNKIMKDIEKYDTNDDGIIDYNDIEPEEKIIQEEMENIGEEMEKQMKKLKKIGGEFDKLVSIKRKTVGEQFNIDGYDNNEEFSIV